MKSLSLESQAFQVAQHRISDMSDDTLTNVWSVATGIYACPENGWGTFIDGSWAVITWDEWCDLLYSELFKRGIKVS